VLGELARTLPGAAGASRDLGVLIDGSFPAGSFDIDAKVREALEQIEQLEGPETFEPTSIASPDEPMPSAFVDGVHTNVIWPTTSASDPLAPEAMAQLQEQLSMQPAMLQTPANSCGSAEFAAFGYSNPSGASFPNQRKKSSSMVPILALS